MQHLQRLFKVITVFTVAGKLDTIIIKAKACFLVNSMFLVMDKSKIISAVLIMCGLIGMGFLLKTGIDNFAKKDNYVSVKGLAEREVMADKVTWPITLKDIGNDLPSLYETMTTKTNTVMKQLQR